VGLPIGGAFDLLKLVRERWRELKAVTGPIAAVGKSTGSRSRTASILRWDECLIPSNEAGLHLIAGACTLKFHNVRYVRFRERPVLDVGDGIEWVKYQIAQIEPIQAFVVAIGTMVAGALAWFGIKGLGKSKPDLDT
jgi:hypothetical protein